MKNRLFIYIAAILLLSRLCWAQSDAASDMTSDPVIADSRNNRSGKAKQSEKDNAAELQRLTPNGDASAKTGISHSAKKSDFAKQCGFFGFLDYHYTPVTTDFKQLLSDTIRMSGSFALGVRLKSWFLYGQSEAEYWRSPRQTGDAFLNQLFIRGFISFGYDVQYVFRVLLATGLSVFSGGDSLFGPYTSYFGPGIDFRISAGPGKSCISSDFFFRTDLMFNLKGDFFPNMYFGMRLNVFPYIQSLSLYVEPAFQTTPAAKVETANPDDVLLGGKLMTFCLSVGMRFTADVVRMRERIAAWKNKDKKKKRRSIRDKIERDKVFMPAKRIESNIAEIPRNRRNYINVPDTDFVRVKGVTFRPDQEEGAFRAGADSITVQEYYICKYEVTQALYSRVLAYDEHSEPFPSYSSAKNVEVVAFDKEDTDRRPVDCVTWYDALYFCNAYSRRECCDEVYTIRNIKRDENKHIISATVTADFTKNGYRLPTEAEWELAARGGDPQNSQEWLQVYSGSNDLSAVGWFYDNAAIHGEGNEGYGSHQVALCKPNSLGIYDMSGNVSEWCWDEVRNSRDGKASPDKEKQSVSAMRVLCGGNWHNDAEACAITYRDYSDKWKGQSHAYDGLGFRLARTSIQTDERLSPRVILNGDFRLIPGRTFCPDEESGAFAGMEEVTIGDYYMSRYPVTQILYRYVLRDEADVNTDPSFCAMDNGVHIPASGELPLLRPVEYVTWYDAVYFCNVYSRLMGYKEAYTITNIVRNKYKHIISANVTADISADGFRLPTEAEWEYAARGADPGNDDAWNAIYAGGNWADSVSWYRDNAGGRWSRGKSGYGTHEVGMLRPNVLGIYDMSGNVWEWCQSPSGNVGRKPSRPGIARSEYRICRGGSWFRDESFCRTLSRNDWLPDQWASDMGFRVVRTKTDADVKQAESVNDMKFDFVRVPGGTVECNETEGVFTEGRGTVSISPFYMSRYEVTQDLYVAVMFADIKAEASPSGCVASDERFPAVDGEMAIHRPVDNVTWYDAVYFCNAYSIYDRLESVYTITDIVRDSSKHIVKASVTADFGRNGYRLPTEAEWEYAARGGSQSSGGWTDIYSGSSSVYEAAWYKENAGYAIGAGNSGYGTHQAGRRAANRLGLCDMSGNVAEMCWDRYNAHPGIINDDGQSGSVNNVIRGGSWSDAPFACAVTARRGTDPSARYLNYGFRVVRNDADDNRSDEQLNGDGHFDDGFVRIPPAVVECTDKEGTFSEARGSVRIDEYYISKYPVTIELYRQVMSDCEGCEPSPSYCGRSTECGVLLKGEDPDKRPAESVSWYDAVLFCNEYSRRAGLEPVYTVTDIVRDETFRFVRRASVAADFGKDGYRLPTRIEWEYAARGADPGGEAWNCKYAGSSDIDKVGWYRRNLGGDSDRSVITAGAGGYGTHQVGSKDPNAIGLFDMSGNVRQWCWDWYSESIDADTPLTGADSGFYRTVCGGAWNLGKDDCQVTAHSSDFPYDTDSNRGIRLVRSGDRTVPETRVVFAGEMADIQGGTFRMGDASKYGTSANKIHSVTVGSFSIGVMPVTRREWASLMGSDPSYHKTASDGEDSDLLPVESISWFDAVRYCNLLSIYQGLTPCYAIDHQTDPAFWTNMTDIEWDTAADGYRLPTEAEWEYAARGGAVGASLPMSLYSGSPKPDGVSWTEINSAGRTHQAGIKDKNELGLSDMSGNVWEWCWDIYGSGYYKDGQTDPRGPTEGRMRVNRGGAFDSYGANGTVGYRSYDYPACSFKNTGLRLARNKSGQSYGGQ